MQTLTELKEHFAMPGVLSFTEAHLGMVRAEITTPACSAEVYLHGSHLTAWQPADHEPVLFLSERSAFAPEKAIRGGVPVIFPWFGERSGSLVQGRTDGPAHGFARTSTWTLAFAAMAGDDLHLTFTLGPTEQSRTLGYDRFQLAYTLVLGRELRMSLTVANEADQPLRMEEALHTYIHVGDAEQVVLSGLGGAEYLDKTDHFARKRQMEPELRMRSQTDRPYLNTPATVTLDDPALKRRITVAKQNSLSTVVWNPWSDGCAKLADMVADGWRHMTCIETANVLENAVTIEPRSAHRMETHIRVEELAQ